MGTNKKRKYQKPRLTKINLDAQTTVLAGCKDGFGGDGPENINCYKRSFPPGRCLEWTS